MSEINEGIDEDKNMEKILGMMQMVRSFAVPDNSAVKIQTPFVYAQNFKYMFNPRIDVLYATLPHINTKYKKNLALIIKLLEIKELYHHYDLYEDKDKNSYSHKDVINAMLPFMDDKKSEIIRNFNKIMEIKQMIDVLSKMDEFKEMFNNAE